MHARRCGILARASVASLQHPSVPRQDKLPVDAANGWPASFALFALWPLITLQMVSRDPQIKMRTPRAQRDSRADDLALA
jgi:hypothetical protein